MILIGYNCSIDVVQLHFQIRKRKGRIGATVEIWERISMFLHTLQGIWLFTYAYWD